MEQLVAKSADIDDNLVMKLSELYYEMSKVKRHLF
jgi:hypothetical protein